MDETRNLLLPRREAQIPHWVGDLYSRSTSPTIDLRQMGLGLRVWIING